MIKQITQQDYKNALHIVRTYEDERKRLSKYKGKSECPFCGGSKTTPLTRKADGHSQDCDMCDKDGNISNKKLASLDLECCIKK